ncbi:MAG: DsbA family protein [Nitrosopumilus sp. B06]|nr:MAG: DsbA family protein [Nitrosopumilus sp. B06]
MAVKWILAGLVVIAVIVSAAITIFPQDSNLDPTRQHGDISTAFGSPILGSPDAPVTIVEFGDYQCHQCYNWFHNTKPAITRDYIDTGKVNLIFVDLAILGNDSRIAAQASHCANDQEKYWEYHDHLYNSQLPTIDGGWASKDNLIGFASDLGLDVDLFKSCLESNKYSGRVLTNTNEGKSNGVAGTPGFFIVNSEETSDLISGAQPFIVFKHILDDMI